MVHEVGIPLVLIPSGEREALAFTERGRFALPRQATELYREQPVYFQELSRDLVALCYHPRGLHHFRMAL